MILCNSKNFEMFVKLRERLYFFLTLKVYFPFCMWVYKGKGDCFPLPKMMAAPPGSLAYATGSFLTAMNLHPMRGYEEHDMKHTLLGYQASLRDEIAMQYFEWSNGNRSLPVLTVILFGTLVMPEEWKAYRAAFRRGGAATELRHIQLKEYAHHDISVLRKMWNIYPNSI